MDFRENETGAKEEGGSAKDTGCSGRARTRTLVCCFPVDSQLTRKTDWKKALENRNGVHVY